MVAYFQLFNSSTLFVVVVDKVEEDHIVEVAKRLLSSQPAVAARGDLKHIPSLEYVQAGLLGNESTQERKLSLFR